MELSLSKEKGVRSTLLFQTGKIDIHNMHQVFLFLSLYCWASYQTFSFLRTVPDGGAGLGLVFL